MDILVSTENLLRSNLHKKTKLATLSRMRLLSTILFIGGIVLLLAYLFFSLLPSDSTFIQNPAVMGRLL